MCAILYDFCSGVGPQQMSIVNFSMDIFSLQIFLNYNHYHKQLCNSQISQLCEIIGNFLNITSEFSILAKTSDFSSR